MGRRREEKPTVCSMHLRKRNEKVSSFICLKGKKKEKKKRKHFCHEQTRLRGSMKSIEITEMYGKDISNMIIYKIRLFVRYKGAIKED